MKGDVHVLPLNDAIEHLESRSCLCRPRIEEISLHAVVIHHAADGREHFESDYQSTETLQ